MLSARAATRHVRDPARSSAPVSAMARRPSASSSAPAWNFVCAAARAAPRAARRFAGSASRRSQGKPRQRRARPAPAPAPPSARARRLPLRRARTPPARGATRGDPGRSADRLRPPARGEPRAARSGRPSRTPPTAQADDGRSPHRRASASLPTPRRARRSPGSQAAGLRATAAQGRRPVLPPRGAAAAARRVGAAPAAA